ncbi:hypothetical protein HI914_05694 [Erysiphe necator]|nr:hypothetical protein HI914_05694 [Erysiphe necator]
MKNGSQAHWMLVGMRKQDQIRRKSALQASIMGLEHDQETHPWILDSSTESQENMEKFPTNRRPYVRQMEEVDAETVEN